MLHGFWLSQLFGFLAAPIAFKRFQSNSRIEILLWGLPIYLLTFLSYLSLQQTPACIVVAITFFCVILQLLFSTKYFIHIKNIKHFRAIIAFSSISAAILFQPPSNLYEYLPLFAYTLSRTGESSLLAYRVRIFMMLSYVIWFFYNIEYNNYAMSLIQIVGILSNVLWMKKNIGFQNIKNEILSFLKILKVSKVNFV
jgi:hypothetical protein